MWEVRIGEGIGQRQRRQGEVGHSISVYRYNRVNVRKKVRISTRGNTETNGTQQPQSGPVLSS